MQKQPLIAAPPPLLCPSYFYFQAPMLGGRDLIFSPPEQTVNLVPVKFFRSSELQATHLKSNMFCFNVFVLIKHIHYSDPHQHLCPRKSQSLGLTFVSFHLIRK